MAVVTALEKELLPVVKGMDPRAIAAARNALPAHAPR